MQFSMYAGFMQLLEQAGPKIAALTAQNLGYQAVELFYDANHNAAPDKQTAKKYRDAFAQVGTPVSCVSCVATLTENGKPNRQVVDTLCGYADFAAAIGSPFLHHTLLPVLTNDYPLSYDAVFSPTVEAAAEVASHAQKLGVSVLYEPQGMFFNGLEGLGKLFDAVKAVCPAIGICGDAGNILWIDEPILPFFQAYADQVRHVHVKDYVVRENGALEENKTKGGNTICDVPIGTGDIPFCDWFRLLKDAGYQGYFSMEDTSLRSDKEKIAAAMAYVKNAYPAL